MCSKRTSSGSGSEGLGYDDAELKAITNGHPAYGSAWRQRDFEAITSPEFKKALADNHVTLVGWKKPR